MITHYLFAIVALSAIPGGYSQCDPTPTTVSGTFAPSQVCAGAIIFQEEFDLLNMKKWQHEVTLAGGGNWEFQWYTNNRTNSFVEEGVLYIKPTLTADHLGEAALSSQTLDLNGGAPADYCTNAANFGCIRAGNPDNILNPIKSARIRTVESFSFKYGRVEVKAKMPSGDWLWPAIWFMPRDNAYSGWPASGEIDLVESRGNKDLVMNGVNIGAQQVGSTMHWGPDWTRNEYPRTHWEKNNANGYNNDFHTYGLEWTPDSITFSVDGTSIGSVAPPAGGFWELGQLQSSGFANPWARETKMAPFDQEFYIIINLAVGGVAYFPDGATNPGGKPWVNSSPRAAADFWAGKNNWLPTWNLQGSNDAALQVDYVRIYAL